MTDQIVKLIGHDGENQLDYGAILYDGERLIPQIGPDSTGNLLQEVIDSPLQINGKTINGQEDPQGFMDNLSAEYKSHALMATKPREATHDDLEGYELADNDSEVAKPVESGDTTVT